MNEQRMRDQNIENIDKLEVMQRQEIDSLHLKQIRAKLASIKLKSQNFDYNDEKKTGA